MSNQEEWDAGAARLFVKRCHGELELALHLADFLKQPGAGRALVIAGDTAAANRAAAAAAAWMPAFAAVSWGGHRTGVTLRFAERLAYVPGPGEADFSQDYFTHVVVYFG